MLLRCLLVTSLAVSCTSRSTVPPPTPPSPPPDPTPTPSFRIQYGLASWYGRERHGRRTASGEIFDTHQLVAAHRTAPFGTYALVTNLTNGRTVQVRINDRGPAIAGRLVDLSYAAARQLDMVRVGVTRVKIEWLVAPLPGYPSSQEESPELDKGLLYAATFSLPAGENWTPRAARRAVGHGDEREPEHKS
jgi:rare lipoprotein A